MAVAARTIAHPPSGAAGPRLRLVRGTHRSPSRRQAAARARESFRVLAACLLLLVAAGVARVSLAASAAEASIDAWELRADIKAERLEARVLEADRSSLAAPSRIEAVASQTLNMTRPAQVSYLQLPTAASSAADTTAQSEEKQRPILSTLVDLAASEAQVMLVGDVGLGSTQ